MNFEKLFDRSDAEKWAHPELVDEYGSATGQAPIMTDVVFNQDLPRDERAAQVKAFLSAGGDAMADDPAVTRAETLHVPGCPEEPETEAEIVIYRPTTPSDRKLNVIYAIPGGGMFACMLEAEGFWRYADVFNCVIVLPRWRTFFEAPYPAAVNDMHAGYQYVVEHADELGINPDKIVLTGASSGSNLSLSLAFRLKRYGYKPRGCVTECGFTDFRPIFSTSSIGQGASWDALTQYYAGYEYLGWKNVTTANDPEMFPNLATAEDCVGLCPIFLHGDAEEPNSASNAAFVDKLTKAGVYNEMHVWGGSNHAALFTAVQMAGTDEPTGYAARYFEVFKGNIKDCLKYDLRRAWIEDLIKE